MSDPLPPLPDEVRAVLDAATPPELPTGFEARVLAKVSGTLAGAGAVASGGAAAGSLAVGKGALVVGTLVTLVLGAVGGVLLSRTVLAPPPAVPPPAPMLPEADRPPLAPVEPSAPAPIAPEPDKPDVVDVRPEARRVAPRPEVEAPALNAPTTEDKSEKRSRDVELASERALLELARTALAQRDAAKALQAVGEHERAFPDGRLLEERELLYVQALARAGRRDEAAARARAFRARFPDSLLLPALEAITQ